VFIVCLAFIRYDIKSTKKSVIDELLLVGDIIGKRTAPGMQFLSIINKQKIEENLHDLRSKDSIIGACIYGVDKKVFTTYGKKQHTICPNDMPEVGQYITNRYIVVHQEISTISGSVVGYIYIKADMSEIDKHVLQILSVTFVLMLVILFGAFLLTQRIQRLISIPVQNLTSTVQKIIKDNDYSSRANILYKDEIGTLGKLFNKMLRKIQNRDIELRVINEHLEDMVTERTQELEKALQAKSNFLSNMSHEIRTPNHAVMNCSIYVDSFLQEIISNLNQLKENITADKLIEDTANLVQEAYEFNLRVRSASERQGHLLNNILDLSKMGEGKLETNMQPNELLKVVNSVLAESEGLYKNGIKDIEVVFNEPKIDTTAEFDYQRMTQVISNLFGNAVKYSPSGTLTLSIKNKSIEIEGKKVSGLMFSIADQGLGIPSGELESIFEKFTEGSHTKQQSGGTGIGLAICRDIIELHNGRIWAKNNKGKGSCFTFVIPRTQPVKQEK
jgi:two-component system sensor histidine kinase ChiS